MGDTTGAWPGIDCLAIMFDSRGTVDELYKDGSGSEHRICKTYELALYDYALQKISGGRDYRAEKNLLRTQGPDGGFHPGYDPDRNGRWNTGKRVNLHRHDNHFCSLANKAALVRLNSLAAELPLRMAGRARCERSCRVLVLEQRRLRQCFYVRTETRPCCD
jgi:hypothetical protein